MTFSNPHLILGAVLAILLAGNPGAAQESTATPATAVPAPAESPATPAAAATTIEAIKPAAEFGYLVCYREKRFVGAALNTSVFYDEVEMADMDNGCYIIIKARPGEHKLRADEKKDTLTVNVQAGKVCYYRMELAMGFWKGHGRLKVVDNNVGEKEFKEWKLKFAPDVRKPDMLTQTINQAAVQP